MTIIQPSGVTPTAAGDLLITGDGLKGETYDRAVSNSVVALASGTMRSATLPLTGGTLLTSATSALSVAGVGMTHGWYLLFDRNQNLLAQTADSPASFQTTGLVTLAFTATLTVPSNNVYYLGLLATTGTSMPTVMAVASNPTGSMAAIGTGVRRSGSQAGLAAPPNPSVLADAATVLWLGVL